MATEPQFVAPFTKSEALQKKPLPCPFTAQGILQPSHLQPPPMFGPRGPTIPPKHLAVYKPQFDTRPKTQPQRPPFQPRSNVDRSRFQQNYSNNHRPRGSPRFQHSSAPPSADNHHQQRHGGTREFWCEPCDRDFRSADEVAEHRQQHQKCGIDGCPYEGHELMVTKHIQMQHSSGLYEKIKNLSTPEEISKWREERRKRYPTKQNIELRQQMQEAKQKRGERLEDPKNRFGRKCDRTEAPKVVAGSMGAAKRKRKRKQKSVIAVKLETLAEPVNENVNGALQAFAGISAMIDYKKPKVAPVKNALSSFLGVYGTSDEDDDSDTAGRDEEEKVVVVSVPEVLDAAQVINVNADEHIEASTSHAKGTQLRSEFVEEIATVNGAAEPPVDSDVDEAPAEHPVDREAEPETPSPSAMTQAFTGGCSKNSLKRPRMENASHSTKRAAKSVLDLTKRYRNQNTMLEKLLQKEVRHERNVLLQCVRYVVENDFFQSKKDPV